MRHIIVAFDSFKGSLTSLEAGEAFALGINDILPDAETIVLPIADGGEGIAEAIVAARSGTFVDTIASDPLGRCIAAHYGIVDGGTTAVIPLSAASGITLLTTEERNPLLATTYGTGELIIDALSRGCKRIIVGLGGSATCDGGVGMLRALGYKFLDANGVELSGAAINILERVATISDAAVDRRLKGVELCIAVDVDNPLCGERGAAHIFAPQKGASLDEVLRLDSALSHYADVVAECFGRDVRAVAGAGAAGGVGYAFVAVMGCALRAGIELILDTLNFDTLLASADLVVTGEGRLDAQTVMGKAPSGVLRRAKQQGVRCIAVGGSVSMCESLECSAFAAIYSSTPEGMPLAEAMSPAVAKSNLRNLARTIATEFAD